MGRRARRPRAGLRAAMALMAGQGRQDHRSDLQCDRDDQAQSGFAPADRHRVESGRRRQDGAAAVPLPVPVLRRQWAAVVPALPALGRRVPRRAVQHRVLCAAHADGGASDGLQAGRIHSYVRRRTSLSQSSGAGAAAAVARAPRAAGDEAQSGGEGYFRLPLRGLHIQAAGAV
jgi:hypothetical protein